MPRTRTNPLVKSPSDVKCIIYLRLSDFRYEVEEGSDPLETFKQREDKLRAFAAQLGWQVFKVITENDLTSRDGKVRAASAFKRRKITLPDGTTAMRVVRPRFREALDHLAAERANALVAEDLDRLLRDPRDLEDFIDLAEAKGINARSLSGSLTFTDGGTDGEITMARMMVTMANKSSRDTSRRVSEGRERQARSGRYGGGAYRPFGFEPDGVTIRPSEAKIIYDFSHRIVQLDENTDQTVKLGSLVKELRDAGVPTVGGGAWTSISLREILIRPRNAGIAVHQGKEVGPGSWKAIVSEDVFRAVVRILTDPTRGHQHGRTLAYLGSGLYRCGPCQGKTEVLASCGSYKCKSYVYYGTANHLKRSIKRLDKFVEATLLTHIAAGGADAFVNRVVISAEAEVDTAALIAEQAAIRANLDSLAEDKSLGLIDRDQLIKGTQKGRARMAEIDRLLNRSPATESPVKPLVDAARAGQDVRLVWQAQPLMTQRAIVDILMEVTINRATKRGVFDEDAIDIRWKEPPTPEDLAA